MDGQRDPLAALRDRPFDSLLFAWSVGVGCSFKGLRALLRLSVRGSLAPGEPPEKTMVISTMGAILSVPVVAELGELGRIGLAC